MAHFRLRWRWFCRPAVIATAEVRNFRQRAEVGYAPQLTI